MSDIKKVSAEYWIETRIHQLEEENAHRNSSSAFYHHDPFKKALYEYLELLSSNE